MREFKGELDTKNLSSQDRTKEKKRLKAYLMGHEFFNYKGKTYYVNPKIVSNQIPPPEENLLPEIMI